MHAPETVMHLQAKAMMKAWIDHRWPALTVELEAVVGGGARVADVLITSPTGRRMVLEIQYAAITVDEWSARHADYEALGIADVWLWGHIAPHWRRPAATDKHDCERLVTPAMRAYVEHTGRVLTWINPEEQLLACGAMRDDLEEDWVSGTSFAFWDHRSAFVSAAPLANWRLTDQGPINDAGRDILSQRHRRAERERKVREQHLARQRAREAEAAERERRAAWVARNADRIQARRDTHQAAEAQIWEREAPRLLEQIGGHLPEPFAAKLKTDRCLYLHHEHWHTIVYARHFLYRGYGEALSYRELRRTVWLALEHFGKRQAPEPVRIAVNGLLWHLRRHGWVQWQALYGDLFIPDTIAITPPALNVHPAR